MTAYENDEYDRQVARSQMPDLSDDEWRADRTRAIRDSVHTGEVREVNERDSDPSAVKALGQLLRYGKLSRFRVLDVVCPNSHRLVQVLRTSGGLLMVGKGRVLEAEERPVGGTFEAYDPETGAFSHDVEWDDTVTRFTARNRAADVVVWLHDYMRGSSPGSFKAVDVQCRCRVASIGGVWLERQIAVGRKRVVCKGRFDMYD